MRIYFPVLPGIRASFNLGGRRRQRNKMRAVQVPKRADALRRQLCQEALAVQATVTKAVAASTSEIQKQALLGWWERFADNYDQLMTGDHQARARALPLFHEASAALTEWMEWQAPIQCTHCGAPEQTPNQSCRYCQRPL